MKPVRFARDARRSLRRMPANWAERIEEKVALYAERPEVLRNQLKMLKGGHGLLRLRVGDWRIVFTESEAEIVVLAVSPRGSAYD